MATRTAPITPASEQNDRNALTPNPESDLIACLVCYSKSTLQDLEDIGLQACHFTRPEHRVIYEAITNIDASEDPKVDIVRLSEYLKEHKLLSAAGNTSYLMGLVENPLITSSVVHYATRLKENYARARLGELAIQLQGMCAAPGPAIPELVDIVEQGLTEAVRGSAKASQQGALPLAERMPDAFRAIERTNELRGEPDGLATGFERLDHRTGGLKPGQFIVICGRPAMGKTAFGMNVAVNAALNGTKVGIFSLEMGVDELAQRMLYSESRVRRGKAQDGKLDEADWRLLRDGATMLSDCNIYIDDSPTASPARLRSKARRLQVRHGIELLVVDYLQLMGEGRRDRRQEVDAISRGLKLLAKELQIPVIALAQLNRSLEARDDKRPVLSDLRESGSIEQDADIVLGLHRDFVYNENADPTAAWGILLKHRNGPTGKFKLHWSSEYTRFEDWQDHLHGRGN